MSPGNHKAFALFLFSKISYLFSLQILAFWILNDKLQNYFHQAPLVETIFFFQLPVIFLTFFLVFLLPLTF
jgi:hypothetical protein